MLELGAGRKQWVVGNMFGGDDLFDLPKEMGAGWRGGHIRWSAEG